MMPTLKERGLTRSRSCKTKRLSVAGLVAAVRVAGAPLITPQMVTAAGCPERVFSSAASFDAGLGPDAVAVGDFNGDGMSDLAVTNYYSSDVSALLGTGTGSFVCESVFQ